MAPQVSRVISVTCLGNPEKIVGSTVLRTDGVKNEVPFEIAEVAGRVGFEPTICGSAGRRLGPGSTPGPRRDIIDSPYNGYNGEPNLSPSYFSSPNRQQFHM